MKIVPVDQQTLEAARQERPASPGPAARSGERGSEKGGLLKRMVRRLSESGRQNKDLAVLPPADNALHKGYQVSPGSAMYFPPSPHEQTPREHNAYLEPLEPADGYDEVFAFGQDSVASGRAAAVPAPPSPVTPRRHSRSAARSYPGESSPLSRREEESYYEASARAPEQQQQQQGAATSAAEAAEGGERDGGGSGKGAGSGKGVVKRIIRTLSFSRKGKGNAPLEAERTASHSSDHGGEWAAGVSYDEVTGFDQAEDAAAAEAVMSRPPKPPAAGRSKSVHPAGQQWAGAAAAADAAGSPLPPRAPIGSSRSKSMVTRIEAQAASGHLAAEPRTQQPRSSPSSGSSGRPEQSGPDSASEPRSRSRPRPASAGILGQYDPPVGSGQAWRPSAGADAGGAGVPASLRASDGGGGATAGVWRRTSGAAWGGPPPEPASGGRSSSVPDARRRVTPADGAVARDPPVKKPSFLQRLASLGN